jgi:hypothetical protein
MERNRIMTDKQATVVPANVSKLGAAIAKAFRAIDGARSKAAEAIKAAFPTQPQGAAGFTLYTQVRETAEADYIGAADGEERKAAKNAFKTMWSRALKDASIRPVNSKGEISQQGAGGGAPEKVAETESAPEKVAETESAPVSIKPDPRAAVTALFGHCDDQLLECVLFAAAHELIFTQWANASAAAMANSNK